MLSKVLSLNEFMRQLSKEVKKRFFSCSFYHYLRRHTVKNPFERFIQMRNSRKLCNFDFIFASIKKNFFHLCVSFLLFTQTIKLNDMKQTVIAEDEEEIFCFSSMNENSTNFLTHFSSLTLFFNTLQVTFNSLLPQPLCVC